MEELDVSFIYNVTTNSGSPSQINTTISDAVDYTSDDIVHGIYQVLVPTLFAAVVLCGSIGNILVIYVILSQPHLRTVTNILLLNLAISDLAFLLICGSFSVVHYVLAEWPLGSALCRIIQYLLYVSCYVTVYTLVAVSAVRYVCVLHGMQCAFIKDKKYVIAIIITIWLVFLLAKIPILTVHGVSYNQITQRLECIISGKEEGQNLFASFFVFAYAVPLAAIASLYLLIIRYIGSHSVDQSEDRQGHVTKVLSILVVTFAVFWLPLHIHLLVAYYSSIPDSVLYKVLLIIWHCLAYINSMLNPFIYNFFSMDFRQGFRNILCGTSEEEIEEKPVAV